MSTETSTFQQSLRKLSLGVRLIITILLLIFAALGLSVVLQWVFSKIWQSIQTVIQSPDPMGKIIGILGILMLTIIPLALLSVISGVFKGGERQLFVRRYLQHKIAPLFALTAVLLCTAMVIIVSSIMGGFIRQMSESAHSLSGDVIVRGDITGFPHYQELIEALEACEEIKAASPIARGYGLIKLHENSNPVEVYGIDPTSLTRVMDYAGALYWHTDRINAEGVDLAALIENEKKRGLDTSVREYVFKGYSRYKQAFAPFNLKKLGMTLESPDQWPFVRRDPKTGKSVEPHKRARFGAVLGIEVNSNNQRTGEGSYLFRNSTSISEQLHLTVLPVAQGGVLTEPTYERLVVVNESKSGLYEIDSNRIYVPFDMMQRMLNMQSTESYERYEEVEGELIGVGEKIVDPARTSEVVVRGAEGYSLDQIIYTVREVKAQLSEKYPELQNTYAISWQELFGTLLGAVSNEKGLLIFLFVLISLVSAVMVGVIFYMIVMEKTRDIGTLRAIGASRGGVIAIFLAYGLIIGASGAFLGKSAAAVVVNHINDIHDWLRFNIGQGIVIGGCAILLAILGIIAGSIFGAGQPYYKGNLLERITRNAALFGFLSMCLGVIVGIIINYTSPSMVETLSLRYSITIWDPRVYFFDKIPTHMPPDEVRLIVTGAVCASIIGALVPAYLAGVVDPVRSLRYE